MYTVEVGFTSYMGQIMPGDEVIDVQMLEPITPGSCTVVKSNRCFPVFAEDVRKTGVVMTIKRKSSYDQRTRFVLSPDMKLELDTMMYE